MEPTCGFEGNSDLYGLGLRLGLYIQYVALVLANIRHYNTEEKANKKSEMFLFLRGAVLVYVLANFIGMVHATKHRCIYACEVVIWLLELLPQLMPAGRPRIKLFGSYKTSLSITDALLYLVVRAFILYQVYFWWRGVNVLPQSPCEEVVWVFVRAKLRGILKHFLRILFLIWTIGIVFDLLLFLGVASTIGSKKVQPDKILCFKIQYDQWIKPISPTSIFLTFVFSVAAIEMTIQWNGISGVYAVDSAGQLLPILVSSGSLLHVLFAQKEDTDAAGEDLA
ncbi:hypothetical protein F5144DRAFT_576517 [Chaetomium tenue]|uniref:Uncharacterized protein n=1 Tax=Chaetomium tenue TaxID=1854479 RepID=A0ACB7P5Q8_9PEZI|nr:hypothetical protein F5144DRAFT_576517 [Chaetomium globosum]